MWILEQSFDTPAEHLAVDEALFLSTEFQLPDGILRIWEPAQHFVVLGRGSQVDKEVHVERCKRQGVPILRRCSGGATIITGPGCLMYSVVIPLTEDGGLADVDTIHATVLERMVTALDSGAQSVLRDGTSDLVVVDSDSVRRKFSGNSLRFGRISVLYHGTLLYDFQQELVGEYLKTPPRMPDYRRNRTHDQFLTNLQLTRDEICERIQGAWRPLQPLKEWPAQQVRDLIDEKYGRSSWNFRH